MVLATTAFDECGHTEALVLQIHTERTNKKSNDYGEFQKHYKTK